MGQYSGNKRLGRVETRGAQKAAVGLKRDREQRAPPPEFAAARKEGVYHWFYEPDGARYYISAEFLSQTMEERAAKDGAESVQDLLENRMKLDKNSRRMYECWLKKCQENRSRILVEIGSLKKFCDTFGADKTTLEAKHAFLNDRFPIGLGSKEVAKLQTHVNNEGYMQWHRDRHWLWYSNKDPVLHKYFEDRVKELGGKINTSPGERVIESAAPTLVARILAASGLKVGPKTISNPSLNELVLKDEEVRKYHFTGTLTEEGSSELHIDDRRLRLRMGWDRSVDITDNLSPKQHQSLYKIKESTETYQLSIGKISDREIVRAIGENPPLLLSQEIDALVQTHKDAIDEKQWPEIRPHSIYIDHEGNITVSWGFDTENERIVKLLIDQYGMLEGTWKSERLQKQLDIYEKYGRRRLTDEELKEVKELIKEIPDSIDKEWIEDKMAENFPSAKWVEDVAKVKKVMEGTRG